TGACTFPAKTFDLDGDGHRGPLPGHAPADPGSCGDDCDDTSAAALPGGTEICDGVDNDCNGVVDDGAAYVPKNGAAPVRVWTNGASATTTCSWLCSTRRGRRRRRATCASPIRAASRSTPPSCGRAASSSSCGRRATATTAPSACGAGACRSTDRRSATPSISR